MQIGILYTGGTIGSVGKILHPLTDTRFHAEFSKIIGPVLKSRFPNLVVNYIPFGAALDSTNLQPSDWCKMASDILGAYENNDAFLILHGTDTMAYSASALSFLFTGLQADGYPNAVLNKPIIITGSQVPLFYEEIENGPLTLRFDTDAYQNVCGAISAAHSGVPEVCLFFRNSLFRGNRTAKTNASEFDAFSSPNFPALGQSGIDFQLNNDLVLHLPTTPEISIETDAARNLLAQQLTYITQNIDGTRVMSFPAIPAPYNDKASPNTSVLADLLTAVLTQTPTLNGLVLESYGEGNFPSGNPGSPSDGAIYKVLKNAHDNLDVILVDNTQVLAGTVNSTAYASGSWLASTGAIGAYDMTPIASLAKLIYLNALRNYGGNNWDQAAIERLMQTNIAGEIIDVNRLDTRGKWFLGPDESIGALDGSATMTNVPAKGPVLRDAAGNTLWTAPLAAGDMPGRLYMQGDGNLVFYDSSNTALWTSDTAWSSLATSMLVLDGATSPGGLRLYIYNYARSQVSKTLYPE